MQFDIEEIKEKLKEPKVRNSIIGAGVLVFLFSGSQFLFEEQDPNRFRRAAKETEVKSLSVTDIEEMDESRMESMFKGLVADLEAREKKMGAREKRWDTEIEKQQVVLETMQTQLRRFGEEVRTLRKSVRDEGSNVVTIGGSTKNQEKVERVGAMNGSGQAATDNLQKERLMQVVEPGVEPVVREDGEDEDGSIIRVLEKETVSGKKRDKNGFAVGEKEVEPRLVDSSDGSPGLYVPKGSIMSGILLTGGDLPTSNTAKSQPVPMLYELRGDVILPNGYSLSLDSCFMITSGFGDISTGRGMVRSETISCVNVAGEAVEARVAAVGYDGEDGKVGVSGTLVSKHSDLLGKTLMASWLGGVSQALTPQRIPQVNTGSQSGDELFITPNFNDVALAGTLNGASGSIQQLSEFYISAAEKILPVVEVGSMKKVDFVVTDGFSLKL